VRLLALLLAALPPSVQAWPIGVGPRYRPPAAPHTVRAGMPIGRHVCGRGPTRFRVHLELFANRRVIVVPAGIGVATPYRRAGAGMRPGGCIYSLHTTAPTGVVSVSARVATLQDLFDIWGQQLGRRQLLSFHSKTRVRAFVAGVERHGDPRTIRLTPHAQIVLEVGGFVPPHPSYLFPKGAR
jgi:hypothetical protein